MNFSNTILPNPFQLHPLHPTYPSLPTLPYLPTMPAMHGLSCMYCPASFEKAEHLSSHIHFHHLQTRPDQARPASRQITGGGVKRQRSAAFPSGHGPMCACGVCRPAARRVKTPRPAAVEDIDEETLKKIQALEWERKHG